ncbi:hypothetical protein D3D03_16195 [Exiguobacterium sp. RIT452]|uniref:hypothetical protein n=1 Tax=Exiguobacterium sp. RIT452 TaxID=2315552 RepID=UPI000E70FD61|nr:hypothetical protein [Exiguobacterium sp. RIT452]RJO94842.1 hypothetical protein D3D03_16195 [Exiguobacterium sp. RIT452]
MAYSKKTNKLYAAAAALAVTASVVAPVAADAASKVSVKYIEPILMKHAGGSKYAVKKLTLPTKVKVKLSNGKYEMRSVKWSGSVKFEQKYINKYQVLYGTVSGTSKKAILKVELQNYVVDILEPVLEPVAVGGKVVLPSTISIRYKSGIIVKRPISKFNIKTPSTSKAGKYKIAYTYKGANSVVKGSINYEVKAAMISNVMGSVDDQTLSVKADVMYPAVGAMAELLIYPGKDMTKAPIVVKGSLSKGKFMASQGGIPEGTHSYVVKIGNVKSAAMDFTVANTVLASAKALGKEKVEVSFSRAVDSVTANNFKIAGGTVKSATLSADKKSAVLEVEGLEYDKDYTVDAKGILIGGVAKDLGSLSFMTQSVENIWMLEVTPKASSILANGSDNTEVTFQLKNKATGEVDTKADDIVLKLSTSFGSLSQERVTIQDGKATVLLTSEFSNTDLEATIDAQIIETVNGEYKDLIGKIDGQAKVKFSTVMVTPAPIEMINVLAAESNQADRVTIFLDKAVSRELLLKSFGLDKVRQGLHEEDYMANDNIQIEQFDGMKRVIGIKSVPSNPKAFEVILDKETPLQDNATVKVLAKITSSTDTEVKSKASFKLTDARQPEVTSVKPVGLNQLEVKFSEAIADAKFKIDGQFGEKYFDVKYLGFDNKEGVDRRDTVIITLNDEMMMAKAEEAYPGPKKGYFTPGKHSLQIWDAMDFAALSDESNIGTTQNLDFTVAADTVKPTAGVVVESPEQFRVMFSKQLKNLSLADVQALLGSKMKLERYNSGTKLYEDFSQYAEITYYNEETGEVLVELKKDWTEIYDTVNTKENYYNDKFKITLAKDSVKAEANGEKNDALSLDLNYSGSPLNTPDLKSAEINAIDRILLSNDFNVMMSEPVKLRGLDQADTPLINADGTVLPPKTTVEFIGKDKDGKIVTIDGSVVGYTNSSDMNFRVAANQSLQSLVDNAGYGEEWKVVVKSLSDDVGNTVATATHDFKIMKTPVKPVVSPFEIEKVSANAKDEKDVIRVKFSEGVQYSGMYDATSTAQYTLNGKNLPVGTSISLADSDDNLSNGLDIVKIKVPAGTLKTLSNVITVNKELQSYDNSVLTGGYEKAVLLGL